MIVSESFISFMCFAWLIISRKCTKERKKQWPKSATLFFKSFVVIVAVTHNAANEPYIVSSGDVK